MAESGARADAGGAVRTSAPDGFSVLPGVVDRHVHLGLVPYTALAGSAVVEVHDLGWDPTEIRRIAAELGGVRVRYAGPFHTAPGGYPSGRGWAPEGSVREVGTVADAGAAVAEARAAGSSAIKITLHTDFPELRDEPLAALVSAARAAGLPAVVHAEGDGQARRAIEAGADVLVHTPWTERLPEELLRRSVARGVEWISTLAIHSGEDLDRALDNARRYAALGGRIAYGTDLGNGPAPVGVNEREIELLGEIGLSGERLLEAVMPSADPAGFLASPEPPPSTAARLIAWLRAAEPVAQPGAPETAEPPRLRLASLPQPAEHLHPGPPIERPEGVEVTGLASASTRFARSTGGAPARTSILEGAPVTTSPATLSAAVERAAALDAADPLARFHDRFVQHPDVVSYLDGNSLGRPVAATRDRLSQLVGTAWAGRLIRAWDETWMDEPTRLGDTIGRVALGAAPGQTVVADSTSVLLYKLVRAALDARSDRVEIVADTENFPTDRFILEGIAAETGRTIRWIEPDPAAGVAIDQVRAVTGPGTALVLLSHVAFKSGYIADMAAITAAAHEAGALVLWDLCHSVGSIDVRLDETGADLAVGCTYKYLNGGPGSPAFAYVAERLHGAIRQPIQGWLGTADPFAMTDAYAPSTGIRQLVSGTPPILGMQPMQDMLELIEEAGDARSGETGIAAIRRKSLALTDFVIDYADEHLARFGVRVISPRDPAVRGSHVTLEHPDFRRLTAELWERGVIPDFRPPQGMRIGLSPLSTSFAEVALGLGVLAELLERDAATTDA